MKHGVYVSEKDTSVSSPVVAASGVPFVIGASPVQSAASPAPLNRPVLCNSWDEFVEKFGYSDDWASYNLCEFAYSQFKLFGVGPVIFCNVLDPATHNTSVAAADIDVVNHQAKLPIAAIDDSNLVVKVAGGAGAAYVKDTDYSVFYDGEYCIVELISTSTHYSETSLNIAYKKVTPTSVNATLVASKLEAVELCMSECSLIPDLLVSPGYSKTPTLALAMATKAAAINGSFEARAIVDIDTSSVTVYSGAGTYKSSNSLTDEHLIVCWPLVKLDSKTFYMSTQIAGLIGSVDTGNEGIPYESPSNKNLKINGLVLDGGTEVVMSKAMADTLNSNGIMTALNFLSSGWIAWGNYTGAYPGSTDPKDSIIPVARMFSWVGNSLIQTFWQKLDKPMNRRLVDSIVDSAQIWLNGLTGAGYLLGARVEMLEAENPTTALMQGILKLHIYMTPASPAQEIDFVLEYDVNYITQQFA
jgi:hypothetical protein